MARAGCAGQRSVITILVDPWQYNSAQEGQDFGYGQDAQIPVFSVGLQSWFIVVFFATVPGGDVIDTDIKRVPACLMILLDVSERESL